MKEIWKNKVILIGFFVFLLVVKSCLFVASIQDDFSRTVSCLSLPALCRLICTYACFCVVAGIPLLFSKHWWFGLIGQVIMDIWLIGNLLYFRTYADLINIWVVENIGNMAGFWTSIMPFFQISDALYIALTVVFAVIAWLLRKHFLVRLSWSVKSFFVGWVIILFIPWFLMCQKVGSKANPFDAYYHDVSMGRIWYCVSVGPIAHGINELIGGFRYLYQDQSISTEEYDLSILKKHPKNPVVQTPNVIIIFVESLESWVLGLKVNGQEITPFLNRLCNNPHTTYFPYVKDQTRHGKSSDAQLLLLAGLRPIEDGAVSMRYANNRFYTLCEAMRPSCSKMYIPTASSEWNQKALVKAWHIEDLYAQVVSDRVLVNQMVNDIETLPQPYFVSLVTLASHTPFTTYADSSLLILPNDIPRNLRNYLRSLNYTDACLETLLDKVSKNDSTMVLAIMGDHTIFYKDQRETFALTTDCPLEAFVPFILYTPDHGRVVTDTIGQVDTYSLLLPYVQQDLYWQGVASGELNDEEQKKVSSWIIHVDAFNQ